MPCDTVTVSTVSWERVDLPRLAKSLRGLSGWQATYTATTGELIAYAPDGSRLRWVRGSAEVQIRSYFGADTSSTVATAKRAYAQATVTELAKKYGFGGKVSLNSQNGQMKIRFSK